MSSKLNIITIILFQLILLILFGIFAKYNHLYKHNSYPTLKIMDTVTHVVIGASSFYMDIARIRRFKFSLFIIFIQLILCVIFILFTNYHPQADASDYSNSIGPTFGGFIQKPIDGQYFLFQDVHVMIFIGFGFLMTFLKRYGYSAVGFNFLLGSLMVQWAILCQGFYNLNDQYRIEIGIDSLYEADIAAATVLISMGAVLGRTSFMQLLVMGIIEIIVFSANSYLGFTVFKVADAGGSIFVHTFGAYFGLAVSYIIVWKSDKSQENNLEESSYTSDLFAMIGTIFLWLFWPSFNAVELTGDDQQRAIINTYLSLSACCVTTFAISSMLNDHHKFDMVHIQNSTLAGGVAVGTTANLMLEPWGAILIGILSAIISVTGYAKLTPWLSENFNLKDTCGVHNLHGMPGVLAGLIGALMAGLATEHTYFKSLYEIYPARAPKNLTASAEFNFLQPGDGRSAGDQAGYQLLAVVVTLAIAIMSGLLTGLVLCWNKFNFIQSKDHYDDAISWVIPGADEAPLKVSTQQYDNAAFEAAIVPGNSTNRP